MSIKSKIDWLITKLSMGLMKRSTRYRLKNGGAQWLQQPAPNYADIFNRVDFILEQSTGKNVLHIGFTDHPYTMERIKDGTLLHTQLQQVTGKLMGFDNEKAAIGQYTAATGDAAVQYADIMEVYPPEALESKPDLILITEVLEHLKDPYKAIDVLHKAFPAGTRILVTVPNYISLDSLAAGFNKTESIHPDHHWYFSPYTLCKLFDSERFSTEQLHFGMYYARGKRINSVLKKYPFNGDCIMAIFSIIKTGAHA